MKTTDYAICKGQVRTRLMAIEAEAKAALSALELDRFGAVYASLDVVVKTANQAAPVVDRLADG